MSTKTRSTLILAGIVCWLTAYLYAQNQYFAFAVRATLQFFNSGVSSWKGILFFGTFGALCLVKAACVDVRRSISPAYILIGILTAQIYGVMLHLVYIAQYGLTFTGRTLAVVDGVQSSNSWMHLHVTKGVIAFLLNVLGIVLPLRGDSGVPFAALLAPIYFLCALLIFSVVIFIAVYGCIQYPARQDAHGGGNVWYIYALSTFICIKSIFDGGLFAYENIVAFAVLSVLLLKPIFLTEWLYRLAVGISVTAVLSEIAPKESSFLYILRDVSKISCFFLVLLLVGKGLKDKKACAIFCLTAAAAIFASRNVFWVQEAWFMTKPVAREAIFTGSRGQIGEGPVLYQSGTVYVSAVQTQRPAHVIDLYQQYGISPGYLIANIDGQTCVGQDGYSTRGRVIMLEGEYDGMVHPRDVFSSFNIKACKRENTFTYSGEIKGCVSNNSNISEIGFLTAHGLKKFILILEANPDSNC